MYVDAYTHMHACIHDFQEKNLWKFVERFVKFKQATILLAKINTNLWGSLISTRRLQPAWLMRSAINLWA